MKNKETPKGKFTTQNKITLALTIIVGTIVYIWFLIPFFMDLGKAFGIGKNYMTGMLIFVWFVGMGFAYSIAEKSQFFERNK